MTGYGVAARELPSGTLTVEIRAVNNRYLDIQFRLPEELRAVEPALRELLAARLSRGKIECRVSLATSAATPPVPALNEAILQQLAALNTQVIKVFPHAGTLRAADVLRWPGVLGADTLPAEALRNACRELTAAALEEFAAARAREGEKLREAILEHAATIEKRVADVAPRLPGAIAAFQDKLSQRLKEALANADDERIRQEVVLYAGKIDVDEELTRLRTHMAELRRILIKGGAAGKRLDFLMQELNREANTLGSKAADIEITQVSMDLKLLIEQMREQIQNIE
ncbi:MAG TPA: YicC/YloC family endoribonuclease [Burkholderiales bacterium]|nr:YicC/YloC family endoribonuclease [Burkholderiales bacterium]